MRKYLIAAAASLLAAAPAYAGEGFADVHAGVDSIKAGGNSEGGAVFGITAGYDWNLGGSGIIGFEVGVDESTVKGGGLKAGRDLNAAVRLGAKVGENGKAYALVGYTNQRASAAGTGANGDGVRAGLGYMHSFGGNYYGKVEYRYSNYEAGVTRHQGLVGLGIKF